MLVLTAWLLPDPGAPRFALFRLRNNQARIRPGRAHDA